MERKQFFIVDVREKVKKFVEKFGDEAKRRFSKKILELEQQPIPREKKHILEVKNHKMLCEFGIGKLRFYYTVFRNIITISGVEYLGKVTVLEGHSNHKSGNSLFLFKSLCLFMSDFLKV